MKKLVLITLLAIAVAAAPGCVIREQYAKPKLEDDMLDLMGGLDVLPPFPEPAPSSGSLWSDGGSGAAMFRDPRAFRQNDLVTIVLNERSLGTNESNTDLSRASDANIGASVAFGAEKANPEVGSFNLNQVLNSSASSDFSGDGTTSRGSRLTATLTTRVMRVLPNGDMVIAGQKNVIVNRERQVLTLVGSIRAADVDSDNRVSSNAVGDLTVRLWGTGEIDDTVRQGWFMRIMHRVWPF